MFFYDLQAQDTNSGNIQIAIFGDPGISGCYGDYPSENNSTLEFSFSAGARLRVNEAFGNNMLLAFDFGFLDVAYRGTNPGTSTYFFSSYEFLTFNGLVGIPIGTGYIGGGVYYAKALTGDRYEEFTDRWFSLDHKDDIGVLAEFGKDLGQFITIGIQGRFGIPSIGESVDIHTWALHGKLAFNIFKF